MVTLILYAANIFLWRILIISQAQLKLVVSIHVTEKFQMYFHQDYETWAKNVTKDTHDTMFLVFKC